MTIQSTEALRCISVRTDRMGTPAPGDITRGLYHIVVACPEMFSHSSAFPGVERCTLLAIPATLLSAYQQSHVGCVG